jgi:hypothetical protein
LFAEYHIYFGDADTGARDNYMHLGDSTVRLEWNAVPLMSGLCIDSLVRQDEALAVSFEGQSGQAFYLEQTPIIGPSAEWKTVAGPLIGTNCVQTLVHPACESSSGFYRLRVESR